MKAVLPILLVLITGTLAQGNRESETRMKECLGGISVFNSSRLTNQHVHRRMEQAIFSYNEKQSFGPVDFDTTQADPTITYRIVNINGQTVHSHTLKRSQLTGG